MGFVFDATPEVLAPPIPPVLLVPLVTPVPPVPPNGLELLPLILVELFKFSVVLVLLPTMVTGFKLAVNGELDVEVTDGFIELTTFFRTLPLGSVTIVV